MTETQNPSVQQKALYPNDQPHEKAPGQWGACP